MVPVCTRCGAADTSVTGYCRCGGVRLLPLAADDHPEDKSWPGTPLVRSRIPNLHNVWLKYENGPLTGSFKDRIMRSAIADAVRSKATGVVVPSSGNAALAAAAAGARAGLPVYAIVPIGTSRERIAPVAARGAAVIEAGTDPSEAYRAADLVAERLQLRQLYSTFAAPLAEWSCRSIGIEAARQLGRAPASVVAPISAGPVLVGMANGVAIETGFLPAHVAIQPSGCCPIVKAFEQGAEIVEPWSAPVQTAATSIADRLKGYPQDGTFTLGLIRKTNGTAAAVSDDEMWAAREALLRFDGLDVELSSSAGVAWLMRGGASIAGDTVCLLTASGFKHTYSGSVPGSSLSAEVSGVADRVRNLIARSGIEVTAS